MPTVELHVRFFRISRSSAGPHGFRFAAPHQRHVPLSHPPLTRYTFVNQGFAVSEQSFDLLLMDSLHRSDSTNLFIEILDQPFLFYSFG